LAEAENILISVQQKYVTSMLRGSKTVELRRRPFRVPMGTRVWIYSKAPQATVAAVANVGMIVSAPPPKLWEEYGALAGVTRAEFDSYFANTNIAWAIFLENIFPLPSGVTLAKLRRHSAPFHPPQFFKRLRDGSDELNLLQRSLQHRRNGNH
jgi:predicted transcriptional regulator